jgi:hypothetical protein
VIPLSCSGFENYFKATCPAVAEIKKINCCFYKHVAELSLVLAEDYDRSLLRTSGIFKFCSNKAHM